MAERYQKIFEHAFCGVVILDLEGRVLDYNPAALRLLGRERGNVSNRPLGEFFGPSFAAAFQERLKHLQQLGHMLFEAARAGSGDDLLLDATLVPWGGQEAVLVFLREVSRRENLDQEWAKARHALRACFGGAARRLFLLGSDGALSAFPLEDPARSGLYEAVPAEGAEEAPKTAVRAEPSAALKEALRLPAVREALARAWSGESVRLPARWYGEASAPSQGSAQPCLMRLEFFPKRGRGGVISALLILEEDATATDAGDEERRRTDRNAALALFSSALLSELNNHLSVIMAQASALRLSAAPGRLAPPAVGAILDSGQQAASLLRRCAEAGLAASERWGPADLNQAALDAVGALSRHPAQRIQIRMDLADGLPAIRGDAGLLREMIVSLGRLARASMPAGGELLVRTFRADSANPAAPAGAGLAVSDTGLGLDPLVRAQVRESLVPPGSVPGDPMDLAFARAVIRQHHGQCEVDGAPGRGTHWRLIFPGQEERPRLTGPHPSEERLPEADVLEGQIARAAGGEELAPAASGPRLPVPTAGPKTRVLLADDEENFREFGRAVLQDLGCETTIASDGQEAFERFQDEPDVFGLVILDAYMPRLGGLETYLRMQVLKPDLPVLFVSGFVRGPSRDALLAACPGKAHVILKPFSGDDLAGAVRKMLGLRASGPSAG